MKDTTIFFIFLIFSFLVNTCSEGEFAQNRIDSNYSFFYRYGGDKSDEGKSIVKTNDGGYILSGTFNNDQDIFLIKTNIKGETLWNKSYRFENSEANVGLSVHNKSDGGFIVSGYTIISNFFQKVSCCIINTDKDGNIIWQKAIQDDHYNTIGVHAKQTTGGGYIVCGYGLSNDQTRPFIIGFLLKLNSSGLILWEKIFRNGLLTYINDVIEVENVYYIAVGSSLISENGSESTDAFVVKIDADGNEIWSSLFGGVGNQNVNSLVKAIDGGFLLVGESRGAGVEGSPTSIFIGRINEDGSLLYHQTINYFPNAFGNSVEVAHDGGYVIIGQTGIFTTESDVLLVKLDSFLNLQFLKAYNISYFDAGYSLVQDNDGEYVIIGKSTIDGQSDVVFFKTNECSL